MGERCYCGKRGCVRCYASTPAISENVRRRISAGEASLINAPPKDINYRHVLAAAEKGDAVAAEELRRAGTYFGVGLANYITLLNPECVVIDGPLVIDGSIFFDSAVKSAKENVYVSSNIVYKKGGSFGYETIAVGAAAMYFEWYMGSPIMK
jgi:predicted NBD/HSP70 family sugar kinase